MNAGLIAFDQLGRPTGTRSFFTTKLRGIVTATLAATVVGTHANQDQPQEALQVPLPEIATPHFQSTHSWALSSAHNDKASPLEELRRSISEFLTLPDDWDGYGASKVSELAIRYALIFLDAFDVIADTFEAFPDTDGTLTLENRWGDNRAYLNFSPTGEIAYVLLTPDGTHRGRSIDMLSMKKLLDAIYF
ncbi:MAG: hypothetical protein K8F32_02165 [Rhodocyclaceae bacterium]|nr:hypothetical protein [Rhodocyclaceae bacterium]